jgi:hypothetical protein
MKRIIILTFIVITTIGFSSCDGVLEALFPMNTEGYVEGGNTIQVKVNIMDYNISDDPVFYERPLRIFLEREDDFMPGNWNIERDHAEWGWTYFDVYFDGLGSGNYRVVVFFDENDNWWYDPGEYNSLAWDINTWNTVIWLPDPQEKVYIPMDAELWAYQDDLGISIP